MTVIPYHEREEFANYYLEDSYVLAIRVFPEKIVFDVDAVLTANHPAYNDPREGEMYCMKHVEIVFDSVTSIGNFSLDHHLAIDANNEKDMGNIDNLTIEDGNRVCISGPWGSAEFVADRLSVNPV